MCERESVCVYTLCQLTRGKKCVTRESFFFLPDSEMEHDCMEPKSVVATPRPATRSKCVCSASLLYVNDSIGKAVSKKEGNNTLR